MRTLFFLLAFTTFATAADVEVFKLATGEVLVHAFKGGVPLPAESKWTVVQGAGPFIQPEGKQNRFNWSVILKPKGSPAQLRDVVRVTVQEVSGKTAVPIFDGPPKPTDKEGVPPKPSDKEGLLIIIAPGQIVSREQYPWLYSTEPTLFVLRVTLFKAAEQDLVLQPVLIGADVKRTLKASGYLQ